MVFHILRPIAVTATLCGIGYWCLSLWFAGRLLASKQIRTQRTFTPPVSILKPLCGVEPQAYENLRSHCIQDYPSYEIIFGVRDSNDPIVPIVRRLMKEFGGVSMRLVVCPKTLGMNFKVSNLIQMLPEASHSYLVINDSDISVPSDYLSRVIGPLQDPAVGMVTCLYSGISSGTLGSRLESLAIESDFVPGILSARQLEGGVYFALGSTMAFPRKALDAIGGLQTLVDYLADDYELGHRISQSGFRVVLADCVVNHHLPAYSLSAFFQHQLRWGRTVRDARPGGYAGLLFTFVLPWSIVALVVSGGGALERTLLACALIIRAAVTVVLGSVVLKDKQVWANLWLTPIRDFVAVVVWVACYMGRRVVWRGNAFKLAKGRLRPA
jgi:ceramide glucosyltransferase